MSKQTAVEWIEKEFNDTFYVAEFGEMGKRFKNIFDQAKAMEREQIEDAYWKGCQNWDNDKEAQHYYNETYKGGEQ
jgi:hypothetical protein